MATTELVYPLAFPKSIAHKCEICGKTASRMCAKCRVTYYCSEEHQAADNAGIHEKICPTLAILRAKQPFLPSEEERCDRDRELRDKKLHLIETTQMIGERHVIVRDCTRLRTVPSSLGLSKPIRSGHSRSVGVVETSDRSSRAAQCRAHSLVSGLV